MLHHVDDKLRSMTAGLLTFGVLSMIMGILVLANEFSLQMFAAIIFFMMAFLSYYMGYKMHIIHCSLAEKMDIFGGMMSPKKSAPARKRK